MYLYNRDRVWTNFYRELLGGVEKRFTENKNKNKKSLSVKQEEPSYE